MTTYNPTASVIDHTSDAGYRAWAADLYNMILNNGFSGGGSPFSKFTQSADTGQFNSTTLAAASRPALNTAGGYVIMAFADTPAATSPIYVKFEVGTGSSSSTAGIWVTVGRGSNGSGTITNIMVARTQLNFLPSSTAITYSSYSCSVEGSFNLVFKRGGMSGSACFVLCINRTSDLSAGTPTTDGYAVLLSCANSIVPQIAVNCAGSGTAMTTTNSYSTVWGGITSTLVGGVAQVFKFYAAIPQVFPTIGLLNVLNSELPSGTSFTATAVGSTSHTYMPLTLGGAQYTNSTSTASWNLSIIWE